MQFLWLFLNDKTRDNYTHIVPQKPIMRYSFYIVCDVNNNITLVQLIYTMVNIIQNFYLARVCIFETNFKKLLPLTS